MEHLKGLLAPKTLHWFSYGANICWMVLGIILLAIFADIENNEPRFDFCCGSNGDKELIRGKCYEQYEKQYIKIGIPLYGFVIINFIVTASVCGIYSQVVKSRVDELIERDKNQAKGRTVCNFLPDLSLGFLLSFYRPNYFILLAFHRTLTVTGIYTCASFAKKLDSTV